LKKNKKYNPASLLVTQSNKLVEARYNLPLSEQRLILSMISKIQPSDEDFKPYVISIKEFAEFLGVDENSMYRECKKITKKLLSRVVEIDEVGRFVQTHWVSSAEYIDGTGVVNLSFDPLLKPYLLQLKSGFTSCKLQMLLSFKSQYTMRFYMLIKQYEKLVNREFLVTELRETIGIEKKQYALYSNFRNRILLPSQKELKEKADLYFEFDEIKYGRRIGSIKFHIFRKQETHVINPSAENPLKNETLPNTIPSFSEINTPRNTVIDKLILLIPEQHQSRKTILASIVRFEKKEDFEYVKRNILYSNAKAAKSYAGFFNSALKNDWGKDWEMEQQPLIKKPKIPEIWARHGFNSQEEYDNAKFAKYMEKVESQREKILR